jgi:hypothetical protein
MFSFAFAYLVSVPAGRFMQNAEQPSPRAIRTSRYFRLYERSKERSQRAVSFMAGRARNLAGAIQEGRITASASSEIAAGAAKTAILLVHFDPPNKIKLWTPRGHRES